MHKFTFSIHVKGLLAPKLTSLRFLVERRRLVTSEVSYFMTERCCPVSEPSSSVAERRGPLLLACFGGDAFFATSLLTGRDCFLLRLCF